MKNKIIIFVLSSLLILSNIRLFLNGDGIAYNLARNIYHICDIARNIGYKRRLEQKSIEYTEGAWYNNTQLIAHAGGGIDGYTHTNTKEAFFQGYKNGYRVFEVDLLLSSDGELICVNDWDYYSKHTGVSGVPTHEEFIQTKWESKFRVMDAGMLLDFMEQHEDTMMILDKLFSDTEKKIINLIEMCKSRNNEKLLDRIIVQVYDENSYKVVSSIYNFKNYIYTTYVHGMYDIEYMACFCIDNFIPVIAIPKEEVDERTIERLRQSGLKVFVYTVNDIHEAKKLQSIGINGFYSDYLQ